MFFNKVFSWNVRIYLYICCSYVLRSMVWYSAVSVIWCQLYAVSYSFVIYCSRKVMLLFIFFIIEAVNQRCSVKKEFLEISQNSQENTCTRVFLTEHLWTTASEMCKLITSSNSKRVTRFSQEEGFLKRPFISTNMMWKNAYNRITTKYSFAIFWRNILRFHLGNWHLR